MKTIAKFDSPEDAYLFLAFLGSREIAAAVLDEYVSQLFWHYRAATGGVRVVIHDEADWDAAEAARLEYFAAINAAPSVVSEVRCWPVVLLVSWVVGVPLFLWGKATVARKPPPLTDADEARPKNLIVADPPLEGGPPTRHGGDSVVDSVPGGG